MRTEIIEFDWTPWEAEALCRLAHEGPARERLLRLPRLRANRMELERAVMAAERSPGQPQRLAVRGADDAQAADEAPPADGACQAEEPGVQELFAAVRRHGDARADVALDFIGQRVRAHGERDVVIASLYPEVREYLLWCAPGQPELFGTRQVARGDGWARTALHLGTHTVTCWLTSGLLPEEARAQAGLVVHYEVPHIPTAFGQRLDRLGRVGREHAFIVPSGGARGGLERYLFSRALGR